jgi:oligopeptide transport system permease protein
MEKIEKSKFQWVGSNPDTREGLSRPSTTFWKDAMGRLFKNKVALVCAAVIIVLILCATIIPFVSPFEGREQHYSHTNAGFWTVCTEKDGNPVHIFGTDTLGRDLFTRIWDGGRVSLFIAFAAVFINFIVGIIYGGISGYFGGALDNVMMRIIEVINGIPYLIIIVLLMMVLPQGLWTIVIAYATTGWTGMARLVRGQVMQLKEQEFVVAAQAMGGRAPRIIMRHLVPNTLSVVIVNVTLAIPSAIFTEAWLSYIGLGVPVPYSSWGNLAQSGAQAFQTYPIQLAVPAICICLTMLSFNLLGDGLRDAFDPRLRK